MTRPCHRLLNGATATNGVPANTAATGSIPATTGASITNLTGFTLDDGINPAIRFVFATSALTDASATRIRIPYTGADSAATVQAAIIAAINAVTTALRITASDGGSSITTLTNDFGGYHGNVSIGGNTTGIAITGMSGGVTVGFPLNGAVAGTKYHWNLADAAALILHSTAGSGAMTISVRMWVYSEETHAWQPLGINSTIASRGLLNDGTLITADPTGALSHAEFVQGLSAFDYIYAEVAATPGGSSTAVDLYMVSCARQAAV